MKTFPFEGRLEPLVGHTWDAGLIGGCCRRNPGIYPVLLKFNTRLQGAAGACSGSQSAAVPAGRGSVTPLNLLCSRPWDAVPRGHLQLVDNLIVERAVLCLRLRRQLVAQLLPDAQGVLNQSALRVLIHATIIKAICRYVTWRRVAQKYYRQ